MVQACTWEPVEGLPGCCVGMLRLMLQWWPLLLGWAAGSGLAQAVVAWWCLMLQETSEEGGQVLLVLQVAH